LSSEALTAIFAEYHIEQTFFIEEYEEELLIFIFEI
jgi:hypothetical protein